MSSVNNLIETINHYAPHFPVKAVLPDETIVSVGSQYYIEANTFYMFCAQENESGLNLYGLANSLEGENMDECWSKDLFGGELPHLADCDIYFANCDVDDFHDIANTAIDEYIYEVRGITVEDGIVCLHCEQNYVIPELNIPVTLSKEEKQMIRDALNHYGDYFAEHQGYSSGELYWDLMEKFN